MNKWIDQVLIPWKNSREPGAVPLLVLDAYRVHMMGSVVNRIQSLGIEMQHIPAGCTYMFQPVDVRVNKKLKTIVCKYWEGLMLDSGINVSVIKPSTPQLIVALVINACDSISVDIVQHS